MMFQCASLTRPDRAYAVNHPWLEYESPIQALVGAILNKDLEAFDAALDGLPQGVQWGQISLTPSWDRLADQDSIRSLPEILLTRMVPWNAGIERALARGVNLIAGINQLIAYPTNVGNGLDTWVIPRILKSAKVEQLTQVAPLYGPHPSIEPPGWHRGPPQGTPLHQWLMCDDSSAASVRLMMDTYAPVILAGEKIPGDRSVLELVHNRLNARFGSPNLLNFLTVSELEAIRFPHNSTPIGVPWPPPRGVLERAMDEMLASGREDWLKAVLPRLDHLPVPDLESFRTKLTALPLNQWSAVLRARVTSQNRQAALTDTAQRAGRARPRA